MFSSAIILNLLRSIAIFRTSSESEEYRLSKYRTGFVVNCDTNLTESHKNRMQIGLLLSRDPIRVAYWTISISVSSVICLGCLHCGFLINVLFYSSILKVRAFTWIVVV